MTDTHTPIHWPTLEAALLASHADCRVSQRDAHGFSLASSLAEGNVRLDLWIHHAQPGRLDARRPSPGEDLAQLPAHERVHLWASVHGAQGRTEHHAVLCDLASLHALLHAWRAPWAPTPAAVVLPPAAAPPRAATPPAHGPQVQLLAQAADLASLPPAELAQAQQHLHADLACLDVQQVARHWPRDARGRLAATTTALLAAYGPPVTTHKRQPV